MALINMDSCGDDGFHYPRSGKWTYTIVANGTVSGIAGMSGRCFTISSGSDGIYQDLTASQEDDVLIMGARFQAHGGTFANDNAALFVFSSDAGTTPHVSICINATAGRILAKRGNNLGTELGRSADGLFSQLQTHYLEAKVVLHDTTGSVQVRLNRQVILNLTNVDTKNGGTKTVFDRGNIFHWSTMGNNIYLDDLYLCNGLGSVNNDFLGSGTVEARRPNGNGNYSQWTGSDGNSTDNYLLVDDPAPNPDDDSTYVEEATTNERDSYTMEDLVATTGTPKAVAVRCLARYTGGGAENMKLFVRRSSTDSDGPTLTLASSYRVENLILNEDPIAAGAWTIANINSMECGQQAVA